MLSLPCFDLILLSRGRDLYAPTVCGRRTYFVIHRKRGVEVNVHAFLYVEGFFLTCPNKQGKNKCND